MFSILVQGLSIGRMARQNISRQLQLQRQGEIAGKGQPNGVETRAPVTCHKAQGQTLPVKVVLIGERQNSGIESLLITHWSLMQLLPLAGSALKGR